MGRTGSRVPWNVSSLPPFFLNWVSPGRAFLHVEIPTGSTLLAYSISVAVKLTKDRPGSRKTANLYQIYRINK